MDHVAIMKKSWNLIPKILEGTKKVESRWYKIRACPWDKVKKGDILYFKNSGEPVTVKSRVTRVKQYEVQDDDRARKILEKYKKDLGVENMTEKINEYVRGKKYAVLVFFDSVCKVKPLRINKKGFGVQAAWLTVKDIKEIITYEKH